MIRPFNITQRYFEEFQDVVRVVYPLHGVTVEDSATWWMKTLYFTCLYSVKLPTNKKPLNPGLFKIFKNWEAYPKGPVSIESYQVFQNMATLIGDYYRDDKEIDDDICLEIQNAVVGLIKNNEYKKIAGDKNAIVNLVRELYLWKSASVLETKRLNISHDISLKIEYELLMNKLKN